MNTFRIDIEAYKKLSGSAQYDMIKNLTEEQVSALDLGQVAFIADDDPWAACEFLFSRLSSDHIAQIVDESPYAIEPHYQIFGLLNEQQKAKVLLNKKAIQRQFAIEMGHYVPNKESEEQAPGPDEYIL